MKWEPIPPCKNVLCSLKLNSNSLLKLGLNSCMTGELLNVWPNKPCSTPMILQIWIHMTKKTALSFFKKEKKKGSIWIMYLATNRHFCQPPSVSGNVIVSMICMCGRCVECINIYKVSLLWPGEAQCGMGCPQSQGWLCSVCTMSNSRGSWAVSGLQNAAKRYRIKITLMFHAHAMKKYLLKALEREK